MDFIPAIDLQGGHCVRLRQGKMDTARIFSADPPAMARHWANLGAKRLHVVDLDGAFTGEPKHVRTILSILEAVPAMRIQVGGGIRDMATAQAYLDAGAELVVVGTRAVQDPSFLENLAGQFPGKALLGLDARGTMAATDGWKQASGTSVTELVRAAERLELAGVVYTDISRDGMLSGPNIDGILDLASSCSLPIIASGGVATAADLHALGNALQREKVQLSGLISGRALYEGTLTLPVALEICASL